MQEFQMQDLITSSKGRLTGIGIGNYSTRPASLAATEKHLRTNVQTLKEASVVVTPLTRGLLQLIY